jgi:hypothetical protein
LKRKAREEEARDTTRIEPNLFIVHIQGEWDSILQLKKDIERSPTFTGNSIYKRVASLTIQLRGVSTVFTKHSLLWNKKQMSHIYNRN